MRVPSPLFNGFLGLVAVAGLAAPAQASSFTVSPVRIELSSAHRTALLTVQSDQDEPVVLQARPKHWTQRDGDDALEETQDVLLTPAVFTLPPHGQQVLRIALRTEADARIERDFRVIIDEVPAAPKPGFTGLNIALRLSVPVFVKSAAKGAPALEFASTWDESAGKFGVTATNTGTEHLQIRSFEVHPQGDADSGWRNAVLRYVLPGSRVSWDWSVPTGTPRPTEIDIKLESDQGPITATVKTSPAAPATP